MISVQKFAYVVRIVDAGRNAVPSHSIWNARTVRFVLPVVLFACLIGGPVLADDVPRPLQLIDVFELEFATDPQISPDGSSVVYVRNSFDIRTDRKYSTLWSIDADGANHRALSSGKRNDVEPRWSPDGKRLAWVSKDDSGDDIGDAEIFIRWMDTGQTAQLTRLPRKPESLAWSPDGRQIAFTMLVPADRSPLATLPTPPSGAEWAKRPKVIERVNYRYDGKGYLEDAYRHVFVIPADGGSPRPLTTGPYRHEGPLAWVDNRSLICSGNRTKDWELNPQETNLYEIRISADATTSSEITQLTKKVGPDENPIVHGETKSLAWIGYYDKKKSWHQDELFVDNRGPQLITKEFDRSVVDAEWGPDGTSLFVQHNDKGVGRISQISLRGGGDGTVVAENVGGTVLGRPYQGGSFSAAQNGALAFTQTSVYRPADVSIVFANGRVQSLTHLNDDLLGQRTLGEVEVFEYQSSADGQKITGWLVTPPGFDAKKKYPLILEIHGGPFANYGSRFSAEVQLYAAAGYCVLYTNPRGSTSYGQAFADFIDHNYPSQDYDDLMSGVDAVLKRGFVDEKQLFVTGGSGGGILTAWVVGKTNRFRAAVSAKPVINWFSFALTTDAYPYFWQYWFDRYPWEAADAYYKRSPISLVGNVTTPTMLLTGEQDHRTPIPESEQFYQALKLRGVDSAMVRIPDASHGIVKRPSNLINKVAHILGWFERYRAVEKPDE